MAKNSALERIESHEKLCRIMQKQTHQKINNIESEIKDIKRHMYYAMSALIRSEEHTSELQSRLHLVCRLLLEKKNKK